MESPLTGNKHAHFVSRMATQEIIRLYQEVYHIDVKKYFENLEYVEIYECDQTKFRFYYPFSLAGDRNFYEVLSKNYKEYYKHWKWEYNPIAEMIQPRDRILEVGCGNGRFIEEISKKGAICTGLEYNLQAVEEGQKKGLNILAESLADHAATHAEQYDVVCSFQVVEHIAEVKHFIEDSIKCVKKGGKLVISVPNNDSVIFKNDPWHILNLPPHHMGLWTKDAFTHLPTIFPNISLEKILIEPTTTRHASEAYKLHLKKYFKKRSWVSSLVYLLTRKIVVTVFPKIINEGTTIIAIFKKI